MQDLQKRNKSTGEDTDDVFEEWVDKGEEEEDEDDSQSIASLTSADFSLLTANEMLLDHLQKFSDEAMLRNIDHEKKD